MLACQTLAWVAITAWVAALMYPFYYALKAAGYFRVDDDVEEMGLDACKHGGSAYAMDGSKTGDPRLDLSTSGKVVPDGFNDISGKARNYLEEREAALEAKDV